MARCKDTTEGNAGLSLITNNGNDPEHAIALRLRAIRLLVEAKERHSSLRFADLVGVGYCRLESGQDGLVVPRNLAEKLVILVPGLTLEWIYQGSESGLSDTLSQELRSQLADAKTSLS